MSSSARMCPSSAACPARSSRLARARFHPRFWRFVLSTLLRSGMLAQSLSKGVVLSVPLCSAMLVQSLSKNLVVCPQSWDDAHALVSGAVGVAVLLLLLYARLVISTKVTGHPGDATIPARQEWGDTPDNGKPIRPEFGQINTTRALLRPG